MQKFVSFPTRSLANRLLRIESFSSFDTEPLTCLESSKGRERDDRGFACEIVN